MLSDVVVADAFGELQRAGSVFVGAVRVGAGLSEQRDQLAAALGCETAFQSGVLPCLSVASTTAPASSSARATSTWCCCAAKCSLGGDGQLLDPGRARVSGRRFDPHLAPPRERWAAARADARRTSASPAAKRKCWTTSSTRSPGTSSSSSSSRLAGCRLRMAQTKSSLKRFPFRLPLHDPASISTEHCHSTVVLHSGRARAEKQGASAAGGGGRSDSRSSDVWQRDSHVVAVGSAHSFVLPLEASVPPARLPNASRRIAT